MILVGTDIFNRQTCFWITAGTPDVPNLLQLFFYTIVRGRT